MVGWTCGCRVLLVSGARHPSHVTDHSFLSYRAIYRLGDSRVGQWSNPVRVTVGG